MFMKLYSFMVAAGSAQAHKDKLYVKRGGAGEVSTPGQAERRTARLFASGRVVFVYCIGIPIDSTVNGGRPGLDSGSLRDSLLDCS